MWRKKTFGEQRNQSLFKEKSPRILKPCDSRHCAPHSAALKPACLCTTTAPNGGEDADFCNRVLLRLCAAVPPEHALFSTAGVQQVQSGTGELKDACFCHLLLDAKSKQTGEKLFFHWFVNFCSCVQNESGWLNLLHAGGNDLFSSILKE